MKRDNIHHSFRSINGYPQPFKFVISPREPGKTTAAVWEIMHKNYLKGGITILLMRNNVDITEGYIYSIQENNNKFDDAPKLKLSWKADELKGGIVHIYNEDSTSGEKRLFAVCVSLSTKNSIRKRLQYPNAKAMIMDEFICDLSVGEKYLKGEYARFLETYNRLAELEDKIENGTFIELLCNKIKIRDDGDADWNSQNFPKGSGGPYDYDYKGEE